MLNEGGWVGGLLSDLNDAVGEVPLIRLLRARRATHSEMKIAFLDVPCLQPILLAPSEFLPSLDLLSRRRRR